LTGSANAGVAKQPSTHRRAISSFVKPPEETEALPKPPHLHHSRSTSLPHRRNTIDSLNDTDSDESIGIELTATRSATDRASVVTTPAVPERPPILPPLSFATPPQAEREEEQTPEPTPSSAGGWWDVVSAVQTLPPSAPWSDSFRSTNRTRTTSGGFNSLPLPPGAEPATIPQPHETQLEQFKSIEKNSTPSSSNPATPAKRILSLEVSPVPSPHMDFSKRQSVTTVNLNEELGNLMISPEPTKDMPTLAPIRTDFVPPKNVKTTTPYGPARHHSDLGQAGGSSSRASPAIPGYHRAQTDSTVGQAQHTGSYSDSESEPDVSPSQPTIRHVGPASQHPMLQTMARAPVATPPSNRASASPMSSASKPKSRGWKSVSAAMGISKDKDKHKEKEKEKDKDKDKENEKIMKSSSKAWPENDPGRWNKNMVANIMGPPADRR
jgi:hypothetical protein